jgi:hypothetical protein
MPQRTLGSAAPVRPHLQSNKGVPQPTLTRENKQGALHTQLATVYVRRAPGVDRAFLRQLRVRDERLIPVVSEEQEEFQWRGQADAQMKGRLHLPRPVCSRMNP